MTSSRSAAWILVSSLGCAESRCPPARTPPPSVRQVDTSSPAPALGFREVIRKKNYLLELGPYAVEVDPNDGGRIVRFSLDGQNVVLTREESYEAYGSSFWTSPQSDWTWPPPPELDRGAWSAEASGAQLQLRSARLAKLDLTVRQSIAPGPEGRSIAIEYAIENVGTAARRVAPWQNTRVRPNGLTIFPSAGPSLAQSTLKLEPEAGVVWFRHDAKTMRTNGKAFADGREGWLAHVDGELLFIKVFPDVPPEAQAPGEAEIELYVHESGQFVEVEQQGPYAEIAPGGSSSWRVFWLLSRLPPELAREPQQPALLELIRSSVRSIAGP